MIVRVGNLFETKCTTIVNTVNCVGVMGKGIALECKKRYPDMYHDYVDRCNKNIVKPGEPYLFENGDGTSILNFPTKDHWRSPSRLSYVVDGLDWFIKHYAELHITSIAFPPLGCGNGGLPWETVGPLMYQKLSSLPIDVEIYAPFGTNPAELSIEYLSRKIEYNQIIGNPKLSINPKWYLILETIREVNDGIYTLNVGRTIYQKICYVLTRGGIQTGFAFVKGNYGPYSSQAKDSITSLANANLIVERQLGKMIAMTVPDSVVIQRNRFTENEWNIMEKTVDLFGRIKSTEQAELVATVLYAYDQLKLSKEHITDKEVYDYVVDWKPHWKTEKEYELCDAIANMAMLGFIEITYSGMLMNTLDDLYL